MDYHALLCIEAVRKQKVYYLNCTCAPGWGFCEYFSFLVVFVHKVGVGAI